MRSLFLAVLAVLLFALPAMANNSLEDVTAGDSGFIAPVPGPVWQPSRSILFDNGPLVTHPGGGFGGADASAVQTALLLSVYGFGCQQTAGNIMADDFTVPAGETWNVDSYTFFNYQTGSTTVSTMTGIFVEIYNGNPSSGGTVIFGDQVTNRMTSSAWSNDYRVLDTNLVATNRPIMASVCQFPMVLSPGQYWVAYTATGSLTSGPWAPPVSILGNSTTGDALQFTTAGGWAYVVDTGSQTGQGIPFIVQGELGGTPTEHSTWGAIKSLFR